uniref:BhlA n=1 Tax=Bacillus licheniformis TaxID=1402 RepID=B3VN44_BACLI|nr:BhlA [Bacillus licheniformis]
MGELDVIKYFLTQRTFAVLFTWLLICVMKSNRERESRLQDLLDKFSDKYDVIIDKLDRLEEKFRGRE